MDGSDFIIQNMPSNNVKIVVFVPETHTDIVREVMGQAGAGEIGKYEEVVEERIEVLCSREKLQTVVEAIKKVHPYDEVALDIYPLEDI